MMRFAAYYGFTIDCNCNIAAYNSVIVGRNLPETCSGLNLARWVGTASLNVRPVSMPPMGGRTWPNKPGPPDPLMGCGPNPNSSQTDFAAICMVVSSCNSFETKFKTFKLKSGLQSSDLNYMLQITAFYVL
jgi:hypothetical protein